MAQVVAALWQGASSSQPRHQRRAASGGAAAAVRTCRTHHHCWCLCWGGAVRPAARHAAVHMSAASMRSSTSEHRASVPAHHMELSPHPVPTAPAQRALGQQRCAAQTGAAPAQRNTPRPPAAELPGWWPAAPTWRGVEARERAASTRDVGCRWLGGVRDGGVGCGRPHASLPSNISQWAAAWPQMATRKLTFVTNASGRLSKCIFPWHGGCSLAISPQHTARLYQCSSTQARSTTPHLVMSIYAHEV